MDNKTVVKSAFWYTASNVLIKALSVITIPIFARMLSVDDFGYYNNYTSWLAVMTIVVSLSLEATLINAKKDFEDDLKNYVYSMALLSVLSASIWLVIALIALPFFETTFILQGRYVICIFIYLLFFPCITLFQTWERFVYKYKVTVALSILLSCSVALLSVMGAYFFTDKLAGIIYGRTLPPVLMGLAIVLYLKKEKSCLKLSYWKYALPIVWPYIPHLLAGTVLGAMNKIFITRICGAEANGFYSLAYNVGLVVTIFITSLNGAFAPWLGDNLKNKAYDRIRKVARPYIVLFSLLTVLAALLAPEALFILGGEKYLEAIYVIPPIMISCVFQFIYGLYVNIEQYEKKTVGMAAATISAAVLNIVLDIVFLPRFGYISAAYATVISYIWLLLVHMRLVFKLGFKNVYDNKFNLCGAILVSCFIVLISFCYVYPVIRWSLFFLIILIIGFFGIKFKEEIKLRFK